MLRDLWDRARWHLSRATGIRALAVLTALSVASGTTLATDPSNVVKDTYFLKAQKSGTYTTFSNGQTFGDWKVSLGSVDLKTPYFKTPTDETNCVDLNGSTSGEIQQDVTTEPGKTYVLQFMVSGNWESTTANRNFRVTAGVLNKSLGVARPADWSRTNMKWKALSYPFIATSTTTKLRFTSLSSGCRWSGDCRSHHDKPN